MCGLTGAACGWASEEILGLRGFRRNCSATVKLAGGAGVFERVFMYGCL